MDAQNTQLMIIQALGTCIARKKQKFNRRKRKLEAAEAEASESAHQLRRCLYKSKLNIQQFEELKLMLELKFSLDYKL